MVKSGIYSLKLEEQKSKDPWALDENIDASPLKLLKKKSKSIKKTNPILSKLSEYFRKQKEF